MYKEFNILDNCNLFCVKNGIAFIIILFSFLQLQSHACSCIGQYSVKKEIRKSDAVITGKVISREDFFITDSTSGINIFLVKYSVAVEFIYKGKLKTKVVEIITGIGKGDCGFEFEIGECYVVYAVYKNRYYAQGKAVSKFLYTDICKRTRKKERNEVVEIEKFLRPKQPCPL